MPTPVKVLQRAMPTRRQTLVALAGALAGSGSVTAWGATTWQLAGLAEWLHGAPPPRPKAPRPEKAATVSRAAGVGPDAQVEDFLRALAAAIQARDGQALRPRLADRYSVDGLPSDAKAADFFMQAIEQIPAADEIVIRAITVQGDVRTAQTDFRYPKGVVKPKAFQFDAAGRLLASDLFRLERQVHSG